MVATDIAILTNAAIDLIMALNKVGAKITSENLDAMIAERQVEIDKLDAQVNQA